MRTESDLSLTWRPRLQLLSNQQVKEIHTATLPILEDTGVQLTEPEALELLDGAGVRVEETGSRSLATWWSGHLAAHLRESRLQRATDAAAMATLCDGLPHMDFLELTGNAADSPPEVADRGVFKQVLTHTEKLIGVGSAGTGVQSLLDILDMAALVAGGREALCARPFLWYYAGPISPLVHVSEAVRKLLICADWGILWCTSPCHSWAAARQ